MSTLRGGAGSEGGCGEVTEAWAGGEDAWQEEEVQCSLSTGEFDSEI